jgi:hypothetical protein
MINKIDGSGFEYKKLEHLCEQKMMNNVAMDIVD